MKFFKQANRHEPANGIFGDCHRTCMASLLGFERDDVPNFGEHYNDYKAWGAAVRAFLRPLNLAEMAIAYQGEAGLQTVFDFHKNINPGVPFVLGGFSASNCNHSVIADGSGILHDPSLNDSGIVGPCDDGFYWTYHYVRVPHA